MKRGEDIKRVANYLNVGSIHVKFSDFDKAISKDDLIFVRNRLENMFREVQDKFKEYGKPVRIITMLMPDKLGVISYDGRTVRFYLVDTNHKTISTTIDYQVAKALAKHDITYIKRAKVLSKLQQEYPGQPKELFSEIEQKLSNPVRAGPKGYAFGPR